ncbi:amino acid adenylation domain-containing protein [Pseudomonas sp. N3-W]|uniref:non-ribosomal peptide synthetase n=1 Tax=Pseudomonas sp. N3-W TaxID=2975049 RepID=UPI00217DFEA9|nr:non-ribosomal peptide synthetase [Pseudomonas sp. N3-W]UWF47458.1 amino acid adenylation domain-containing protein [Pseudomonas sp. N3-W]
MNVTDLLATLKAKDIQLSLKGDQLSVQGNKQALSEPAVLALLREHKPALIELIRAGEYSASRTGNVTVPANGITPGATRITPAMLTLVTLEQDAIDRIVATVPGGAANVQDIYPLAPLQEGILYHHVSAEQGDPYIMQSQFAFDSLERLNRFAQALQCVIDRHDILRTSVLWEGLEQPVQVVWRQATLTLEPVTFDTPGEDVCARLHERYDGRRFRLDVGQAPLVRLVHARDDANQRIVAMLLFHHMVMDHSAQEVLGSEMQAFLLGQGERLGPPVPFRNYVAQALLGISEQEHEAFFRQMLGDIDEPTLPFGLQDVQGDGNQIQEARLPIADELGQRLRAQARHLGVSAASLFHMGWAQVLGVLSGKQQVVFGTVLMGRMQGAQGTDRALGIFINTLPLRVDVDAGSVRDGVKATHARLTTLLRHEHAPLALAQRCSSVVSTAPLFSALLNYRHSASDAGTEQTSAWQGIQVLSAEERSNYPLTLSVDDLGERFRLTLLATVQVDPLQICGYLHTALENLVQALEHTPEMALNRLPIMSAAEQAHLLDTFNNTAADYPQGLTLHQRVEARAGEHPDAIAAVYPGQSLSYAELNRGANQLAHHLRELGVQPDDRVAIVARRGLQTLTALLAILKSGACYVPIDPAHPAERLRYLLTDSEPVVVLTQQALLQQLPALDVPLINLDQPSWQHQPESNVQVPGLSPSNLAYVIYTSGSTGLPKGVMVEHQTLSNLVDWHCETFDLRHGRHTSSVAGFGFDAMAWEVWPALCVGATLHLPPAHDGNEDIDALLDWWRAQPLDVSFLATPVAEYAFSQNLEHPTLRTLLIGGDRLRQFSRNQSFDVINNYGPTEATVVATSARMDAEQPLHIGQPIANARVYLLDEQQRPVPIGVAGELYVGGAGVARGYLNRPQLTAERFLDDPFGSAPQARMYRTGDLARWMANGTIEYLGRNDDQVKIRGMRIELGEIETRLSQLPGIQEAVVLAREDQPGQTRLVAYFTEQDEVQALEVGDLRARLLTQLPEYMVPAAFVKLPALPLTANGKLDRKALPEPDLDAVFTREYEAPQGEIETALAQVWTEVLHVERVGRRDHFFELGGHSLLAMRMVSRVRMQLGVELVLSDLFANPELAAVAQVLAKSGRSTVPPIVAAARDGGLPLSFSQQRLWFLAQMGAANSAYNIPAGLTLRGALNVEALQRALARIVERHETLRSRFVQLNAEPQVLVAADSTFSLLVEDLRDESQAQAVLQSRIDHAAAQPFDLEHGPLIRGRLLIMANDEHVLLLTMHHIVSDGWSMGVLTQELMALYQAFSRGQPDPLPALSVQYGDFALWQRRWLSGDVLQRQTEYWQQALAGAPALLTLPTDRPRPGEQDYAGSSVEVRLDEHLSAALKALGQRHGTTLYMTLMAAWAMVLSRLAGQDEVVIGSPAANRQRSEVEGLIGLFVNTLAVRLDVSGALSVEALLARAKGQILAAQAHQDLPFEQVVEITRPVRSLSYSPLFQTSLAWQNLEGPALELADIQVQGLAQASHFAKFDLTLNLGEMQGRIGGSLGYATALFDEATVRRMVGYFTRVLQAMVANDQAVPAQVDLLDDAEREHLLCDFNDTDADYPREQTVHGVFEARALLRPDAVAVVQGEESLSYQQLNSRANRLAHHLIGLGVKPGDNVAILLERSVALVVSQLAISKCAAVYVPLDIHAPAERQRFMVEDSQAVVLLTHDSAAIDYPARRVDPDNLPLDELALHNPDLAQSSETVAYIMYTSGSTGTPKGVRVPHRAITRLVINNGYADFNPQDRVAFASNPAFDASTMDVWGALLNGAQVLVIDHHTLLEPAHFGQALSDSGATILFVTTALFNQYVQLIPEALKGLRILLCGGERADPAAFRRLLALAPDLRLVHCYGPTETTTYATTHEVKSLPADADSVPIGGPISNTRIYVLDERQQPVPSRVTGEICIGGEGVAKGYLNRPELTAEKFVADPFSERPEALMYRTGDLGRWSAQGLLECIGRNDDQVKIRGFRIELGEIEMRLATCPGVNEVVVLAREDVPGDKRLVAYYTAHDQALDIAQLRAHLQGQLPDYMVPSAYVQLASLPLTGNGKLDRKALPAPDHTALLSRAYEAPSTELEQTLARLWAEVLTLERVGRHDNFFELGGHSLLAVRLVNLIQQAGLSVSLAELFQHASIESLATLLSQRTSAAPAEQEVMTVRVGDRQPALFLVHEFSGQDVYFPALGRHISGDFPIYGLPGRALGPNPLQTMECLAARLVTIIRGVQPHGPYRLAGWSFGGVLAYEIALQLLGADEEVDFLGLIDTYVPRLADQGKARWSDGHVCKRQMLLVCTEYWKAQGTAGTEALAQLQALEHDLEQLDFQPLLRVCRDRQLLSPAMAAATDTDLQYYLEREVGHGHAMAHYSLAPMPLPLHLFVAQDRPAAFSHLSKSLGWSDVIPAARLHQIPVPGGHQSMMKAPHIEALGLALGLAIESSAERLAKPPKVHQPLLALQNGHSGHAPIFCLPGAGDSVTGFIGLTEALAPEWPILGLQPRGLDGETVPHVQVESAARHYLQALEQAYPQGPVHLIGHSFGGWVAFEMAVCLQARGRQVLSLTLIDSESPGGNTVVGKPYTTTAALQRLIEAMQLASGKSLGIDAAQFAAEDDATQLLQLHAGMVRVGLLPPRSAVQSIAGLTRTFATALRTLYQPRQPYSGLARLVLAEDPTLDSAGNQREQAAMVEGWRRHVSTLDVWQGPGNHFTLLKPPHVLSLAAWWHDGLSLSVGEVVS